MCLIPNMHSLSTKIAKVESPFAIKAVSSKIFIDSINDQCEKWVPNYPDLKLGTHNELWNQVRVPGF